MSYDNPQTISYSIGEYDFGAASQSLSVKGPSGSAGRLIDICVSATETFTSTTTEATVLIGTAGDTNAYASLGLGTTADTNAITASETSGAIIAADIPADTQVEVTLTAPTGGTPAGIGYVTITIDWF